jgi:hypothetical protein
VQAQTRDDRRVDTLSVKTLLNAPPAKLVDPISQRRAHTIGDYQNVTFVAWAVAPILAFFWLWRSGTAARARDQLRRRFRSKWAARATFGAGLGLVAGLTQAPLAFAAHRIATNVGLTAQPPGAWLADELLRLATIAICTAVLVAGVLALVDRTRLWYLVFIGVLYAVVLSVVAIEPILFSPLATVHHPAPAAIVADGDAIARALGVTPVPIEIEVTSVRSNTLIARASGLGPFDRILLGDTTVARLSPGELRFLLARLYVHIHEHAVLFLAVVATSLFVFAAALAVLLSDRIGFRRDDDALSRLALVGAFLGIAVLALYPVFNGIERGVEGRADDLALGAVHDRAAAIRLMVRRADDDLVALCGRRSARWYFESRPPLGTRIAAVRGTQDPCPR